MLIQTLPPRLMWRVIAIRAASICRFVTYAGARAWMPYSPNEISVPPVAAPERPGWCCLRCFSLRGISTVRPPFRTQGREPPRLRAPRTTQRRPRRPQARRLPPLSPERRPDRADPAEAEAPQAAPPGALRRRDRWH